MILEEPWVTAPELQQRTGWELKPEGACKGAICVPLPDDAVVGGRLDARVLAERLRMPLIRDEEHELWVLGPESLSGHALMSAWAPELVLPDLDGRPFALSSLRGQKVALIAWSSW